MGNNRFLRPLLRSSWPSPPVDRLLRAGLLAHESAAAAAWHEFEAAADFDHLTEGEMQLIGLVSGRLSALAPDSPMRARMEGIERANWARAQLTIDEAGNALRALQAQSIDMLVLGSVGQSALGDPAARGRIVDRVDVVARDLQPAFDCLTSIGWRPAGPRAEAEYRSELAVVSSTNLIRNRFGKLRLHRSAFSPPSQPPEDDAPIWERSVAGQVGYACVRVPSPTDAIAIALGHGPRRAHRSGEWLADIASGIDRGVDWDLLERVADRHRLQAPAAIALRYLSERLGRPVPQALLTRLERRAIRRPSALLVSLAETRPKTDTNASKLARWIARRSRNNTTRR